MPKMLADGGRKSLQEQAVAILDAMTARTWDRDRARLRELLASL